MSRPVCKCHGVEMTKNGGGQWKCTVTKRYNDEKYDRTPKGRANIRRKRLREACRKRDARIAPRKERFYG